MSIGMLNIYIAGPEDCEMKMRQFAGLVHNLRKATKAADANPNPDTYATKTFWETRADEVLKQVEEEHSKKSNS